jgi:PAS domain S-box-containing protein
MLGFAGNYFKLSLFYGFDILFGSIFLMIILHFFGIYWAVLATFLASLVTYTYWHHPYGILSFSMEMIVVGLLYKKYDKDLVFFDFLYWVFIGCPLNLLFYFVIMKVEYFPSLFVMLKQSVNGIVNVLIASIVIDYIPVNVWFRFSESRNKISLRRGLFHIMLAMILLPPLAIMISNSRKSFHEIEVDIARKLQNVNMETKHIISSFVRRHRDGVVRLARVSSGMDLAPSGKLQRNVDVARGYFPDFQSMYVGNTAGRTVAFSPEIDDNGQSNVGRDFSDRAYFQDLKKNLRPVMSDVFAGRVKASVPIVTLSVPILEGGRFAGYALGAFDLSKIQEQLERVRDEWGVKAVVLDRQGKVIATANEAYRPLQILDLAKEGEMRAVHSGISNWLPPVHQSKSAFDRWKKSFYVLESPIGDGIPWTLLLADSVAPYQKQLYETTYINSFAIMLAITAGAIFLSSFLSRKLVQPIECLKNVSTDLPSKISIRKTIDWPKTNLLEIHSLVGNFQEMTSSLMQKFVELKTANESLERRVAERTVDLEKANEELFTAKEHLEETVGQRTEALLTANEALLGEIAKHRKTEKYLADEKELLSTTLQGIGDGVISVDTGGNVVLMNKVAEELTGWVLQEAAGRPVSEIFRVVDAGSSGQPTDPAVGASAPGAGPAATDDALLASRSGTEYIVSSTFASIRDKDGNVSGGVLAFRDNTEKRKIEERLRNAQKLEAIGVLAGGIAHDFNNLLSAVIGNISLAKAKRDDSSPERLEEIEKASLRAKSLAQQLLTFSSGGMPVRKTISIVDLSKQSAVFVTRGSSVRCEFDFPADLWPVSGDEGQLSQVIHNLVINAMQAMADGGVIRLSAENVLAGAVFRGAAFEGNMVKLSVADEGGGIPSEVIPKIFDPYFTTKEQGSGLGLATAYSVVRRHGGEIDVESKAGRGATFHVYLPASDEPIEDLGTPTADSTNGKGNILVMDDEDYIRRLAAEMLGHLGYEVTCAADGAEAAELYRTFKRSGRPFDAVILDLTVPGGIGGKDAVAILRQIDPGVVAIVSSGYSNDPILADPGKFGFSGIVAKPYTLRVLSEAVHGALQAAGRYPKGVDSGMHMHVRSEE